MWKNVRVKLFKKLTDRVVQVGLRLDGVRGLTAGTSWDASRPVQG